MFSTGGKIDRPARARNIDNFSFLVCSHKIVLTRPRTKTSYHKLIQLLPPPRTNTVAPLLRGLNRFARCVVGRKAVRRFPRISSLELPHHTIRHPLLRRRKASKKLKLSTPLLDQDLQRLNADPASMGVVVSLLHQSCPRSFVRELLKKQKCIVSKNSSA